MINHLGKINSGSVLVYVLLVISLISAIALTVSVIIINELKLTTSAADATMAYYAAESGLERGLYGVKVMRESGAILSDALSTIQSYVVSNGFVNNSTYTDAGSATQASEISHQAIKENQYLQADYYDVDSPLAPSVVESITVQNGTQASNPDTASWAEVSWIAWDENGTLGESTSARKVIGPTDLQPDEIQTDGWPINLNTFGSGFVPSGYRVRIKALFGDLSNISVTPYDQVGGPYQGGSEVTNLASQIVIKSVGEKDKFKQALTAILPWKLPLFGLYDYVLFSEGEIAKTTILSQPVYSSGVIQVEAELDNNLPERCSEGLGIGQGLCSACQALGWSGLECFSSGANKYVSCNYPVGQTGQCTLEANGERYWGWTLPIPDTIPAGDNYYVSMRALYSESAPCPSGDCDRKIAMEINGQSSIIGDYDVDPTDTVWQTCTIPESFTVGNLTELASRTIKFTVEPLAGAGPPSGWDSGEKVLVDWYQLSTYKIFPDCP
jgi:hypothetical protein